MMNQRPPHIRSSVPTNKPVKIGYSSYRHVSASVFSDDYYVVRQTFDESSKFVLGFCFAVIEPLCHPPMSYNSVYNLNGGSGNLFTVAAPDRLLTDPYSNEIAPVMWFKSFIKSHSEYAIVHPFFGGYDSEFNYTFVANKAVAPIYINQYFNKYSTSAYYPAPFPFPSQYSNPFILTTSDYSQRGLVQTEKENFVRTTHSYPYSIDLQFTGHFSSSFFECVYFENFPNYTSPLFTVSAEDSDILQTFLSTPQSYTSGYGSLSPYQFSYLNDVRMATNTEQQSLNDSYFAFGNVSTRTLLRDIIPDQVVNDVCEIFNRTTYLTENEFRNYYESGNDPGNIYTITNQTSPIFQTIDHLKPSIIFLQEIVDALANKSDPFKGTALNSAASSRCSEMFFVLDLELLGIDYSSVVLSDITVVVSNPGVFVKVNNSNICYTFASAEASVNSSKRYVYLSFWYIPYLQESFNENFPNGSSFQSQNIWDSYGKVGGLGLKTTASEVGDASNPPINNFDFSFDFCVVNGTLSEEVLDELDPFNVDFSLFADATLFTTVNSSPGYYNFDLLNNASSVKSSNMSVFFPNYLPLVVDQDYTYSAELYKDNTYLYGALSVPNQAAVANVELPEAVYKSAFKAKLGPFRPSYAKVKAGYTDRFYIHDASTTTPPFPAYIPTCVGPADINYSNRATVSNYSHRYSCEIPFRFHWELFDQADVTSFLNNLYVMYYVTNNSYRDVYFRKSGSSTYYLIPANTPLVYTGTATTRAYRRSYSSQFSTFEHRYYEDTAGYRPVSEYDSSQIALISRCYFTCLALYRSYVYIPPIDGSIQPATNLPGISTDDDLTIPNSRINVVVTARIRVNNPSNYNFFDGFYLPQSYSISANLSHLINGFF